MRVKTGLNGGYLLYISNNEIDQKFLLRISLLKITLRGNCKSWSYWENVKHEERPEELDFPEKCSLPRKPCLTL